METVQEKTYENIYYLLWEAAQRYQKFTQFRVIGKSHDDRMIPMLEIGTGDLCIFCIAGFSGTDGQMSDRLTRMALELCRIYECNWTVDELYEVKKLLDQTRLCIIPVVNPDGYEICRKGYGTVRNPIFRQMLKMQDVPCDEFVCNARGMDPALNFPTSFCNRKKIHQQPASENETKALIRIFQEYASRGLLVFCSSGKKIIYYRQEQGFSAGQKGYRLARHLKKCTRGKLERYSMDYEKQSDRRNMGRPEQFYGETIHQPAFRIEIPVTGKNREEEKKEIQEIMMIPLECIYSLTQQ